VTHDVENHRKKMKQKYKTQWKTTSADKNKQKTESQNLRMKWKLNKTEEKLVKQLKTCERNMRTHHSIKRPNLRIMGIKEGEELQEKGIHNISNKIIKKNSQT
jgi:hypothetical protein